MAGAAGRLRTAGGRKLSRVTAQPTEEPTDPLVILRNLPEHERREFLGQYQQAVDAAHDPAGYQHLRRLLNVWSLTAVAASQPGYYEELAAARAGNGHDSTGHRRDSGLDRTSCYGPGPAVTYRAELSGRALKQMHGLRPSRSIASATPTSGALSSVTRA